MSTNCVVRLEMLNNPVLLPTNSTVADLGRAQRARLTGRRQKLTRSQESMDAAARRCRW